MFYSLPCTILFGHRVFPATLACRVRSLARNHVCARYECRGSATVPAAAVATVSHIIAEDISDAEQSQHVQEVRDRLEHDGILKISLRFADDTSQYLRTLVLNLHRHHGLHVLH